MLVFKKIYNCNIDDKVKKKNNNFFCIDFSFDIKNIC